MDNNFIDLTKLEIDKLNNMPFSYTKALEDTITITDNTKISFFDMLWFRLNNLGCDSLFNVFDEFNIFKCNA